MVRSSAFLLSAWLLARAAAAGEAGPPSACADAVIGARVIAVSGEHLTALAGVPVTELRALSFRSGRAAAIPFQIDRCDAAGELILGPSGSESSSKVGPQSVLLLRIDDGGERDPRAAARGATEVEITAPPGDRRRWAYIERADRRARRSTRDDVDYDPASDTVHAERYTLRFVGAPVGYFSLADGKGRDRGNLLDRFKARVDAHFLWGLVRFRRSEDQVTEELLGYEDGPIRAVRRSRIRIDIGWGLPSPAIVAEDYFYADHAEAPVTISLPFSLAYVFGDLDVRLYLDFRDLEGFHVVADGLRNSGRIVGSSSSESARSIDGATEPKTNWFLLEKGSVELFHRLRFSQTLSGIDCRFLYIDDPSRADPPESVPGLRPAVGYRLTDWSSVGRGRHQIWMETYVVEERTPARAILERLAAPIRVEVHSDRASPEPRGSGN